MLQVIIAAIQKYSSWPTKMPKKHFVSLGKYTKVHVYLINFTIFFRQDFKMCFVFLVIKVSCSATMTFMTFVNVFILLILHLI